MRRSTSQRRADDSRRNAIFFGARTVSIG